MRRDKIWSEMVRTFILAAGLLALISSARADPVSDAQATLDRGASEINDGDVLKFCHWTEAVVHFPRSTIDELKKEMGAMWITTLRDSRDRLKLCLIDPRVNRLAPVWAGWHRQPRRHD